MRTQPANRALADTVPATARQRVLAAAARLFYADGIHAVGVDRIVAEAGVTKATFYRHFPAKDDLVAAYLDQTHQANVTAIEAALTAHDSDSHTAILAMVDVNGRFVRDPSYRGCPFINAAAEYPDPASSVRTVIAAHRNWLREQFVRLLTDAGDPHPDATTDKLILLWDGAGAGGYFDDPDTVHAALRDAARSLIER